MKTNINNPNIYKYLCLLCERSQKLIVLTTVRKTELKLQKVIALSSLQQKKKKMIHRLKQTKNHI